MKIRDGAQGHHIQQAGFDSGGLLGRYPVSCAAVRSSASRKATPNCQLGESGWRILAAAG
jgi:hypothetical protein